METKLATVMREKGVTPRKLAYKLDLSVSFVHRLMNGERGPSIKTGLAISRELGVPFSDLFLASDDTKSIKVTGST